MSKNFLTVQQYVRLVENFDDAANSFAALLHPDVIFIEHPNLITKNGGSRDFAAALKGIAAGKTLLQWQKFVLGEPVENGNTLFVEAKWTGKIAADIGALRKDQLIVAHLAMRFDFKDGKIIRQVNYDCYEPFSTTSTS